MSVTVSDSKDCHVQTRFEHFLVSLHFYLTVGNPELILVRCLGPGNKERASSDWVHVEQAQGGVTVGFVGEKYGSCARSRSFGSNLRWLAIECLDIKSEPMNMSIRRRAWTSSVSHVCFSEHCQNVYMSNTWWALFWTFSCVCVCVCFLSILQVVQSKISVRYSGPGNKR